MTGRRFCAPLFWCLGFVLAAGAWPALAQTAEVGLADEPTVTADEPHILDGTWYGYQTLLADGVSMGLLVPGVVYNSSTPGLLGLAGLAVGAPVIHLLHRQPARALGSLAARVGLFFLGGVIGAGIHGCPTPTPLADGRVPESDCIPGAIVGALVGGVAASVLDGVVFAHEPVEPRPPRPARAGTPALVGIRALPGGAMLAVGGWF